MATKIWVYDEDAEVIERLSEEYDTSPLEIVAAMVIAAENDDAFSRYI